MGGLDDPLETMPLAFLVDTSQALSTYYMLCVGSHLVKHITVQMTKSTGQWKYNVCDKIIARHKKSHSSAIDFSCS